MTYSERQAIESFYKGVMIGQRRLTLKSICKELEIDYIEVNSGIDV
jgi:hypothetical protein